ncbi:MAG: 23S rRNA (uracil(1939)-C(5))-methyltransferase RlmD [Clostridiales Family XIII bacterium]|jgi:23S rRNA (uracil-5-)-methyltransferase RumA|nr:23S rRNA (uracil(1939)-C(5))-methyltransferase RlmD [Clostridiales Family XIII bacterium]
MKPAAEASSHGGAAVSEAGAFCPHADCGGCRYRDVPYAEQLAIKEAAFLRALDERGILPAESLAIAGSPRVFAYRNKMEYSFGDENKGGPLTLGMHRRKRFMSVITTDRCRLVDEDFNRLLAAVLRFAKERGYAAYNKKTHRGLLRNLVVRKGVRTGQLLVNLVTSSQGDIDEGALAEVVLSLALENRVVGLLHSVNDNPGDFVRGEEQRLIFGNNYYLEEIMGLSFKVSAFAFFQTNVEAAAALYETALSWIPDIAEKTVFDLYCGAGTLAQAAAARGAGLAVGIEIVPESVAAARENATLNGLSNCRFLEGDVRAATEGLAERPDVILLDPPRAGVHPKALRTICDKRAQTVVYISCNPDSLADNLAFMRGYYRVRRIRAFDNFPFTAHTEAVALLEAL